MNLLGEFGRKELFRKYPMRKFKNAFVLKLGNGNQRNVM